MALRTADTLMRASTRWLAVVLPLGVLLRSAFVWLYTPGPFYWGNLIHAHSHTAYFGWAGLGLMGLILHLLPGFTGRPVADSSPLAWLERLAPWAVGGALVTFAWWGYGGPSIAFSALNEVLWVLFAVAFWREVRQMPLRTWPPALWLIGAAVLMLLLSISGTTLVIISEAILDSAFPLLYQAGVYLFLELYGDGWVEVGLMGVVLAMSAGASEERPAVRRIALAALLLMAPAALRMLIPRGLEGPLAWLSVLAGALFGAVQFWFLALARRRWLPEAARPWWYLAGLSLAAKALLEFLPLLPAFSAMGLNRSLVIGFLHLKLLLLSSSGLLGALAVVRGAASPWAFRLFAAGSVAMVAALAAHGFLAEAVRGTSWPLYLVAFAAAFPAAIGGIWAARSWR
ncbi:hypothetical protein [Symbiobacterium terraclitae]|uniref:hypothetical protein n=1 Tax=Symbiobacterium terraclitae TaxID=557451 RepID=UPI0035B52C06